MRPPLVIVTSRGYWKRIKWLGIGLGLFALLGIKTAIYNWDRGSDQRTTAYYMLGIAAFFVAVPAIYLWARTRWVHRFDQNGVKLRNGRAFLWKDFERVDVVVHQKLRTVNNYNLVFKTGTAGVYHLMAENYGDVMEVIRALEAGTNPFTS
jgi:hypothetical protein